MDKTKNRNDLLAAGRKKLQQFRQKKDHKGGGSHSKSLIKVSKPGEDGDADEPAKVPEPSLEHAKVIVTHGPVRVSEPLPTSGIEAEEPPKMPEPDSSLTVDVEEVMKVSEPLPISAIEAEKLAMMPEPDFTLVIDADEPTKVSESLPSSAIEAEETARMPEPDSTSPVDADEPVKVSEPLPTSTIEAEKLEMMPEPDSTLVVNADESTKVSKFLPTSGIEAEELAKALEPDSTSAVDADEPTKVSESLPPSGIESEEPAKMRELDSTSAVKVPELEPASAAAEVLGSEPRPTSAVDAGVSTADPLDPSVAVQDVDFLPMPSLGESEVGVLEDQRDSDEVAVDLAIDDEGLRSALMVHHQEARNLVLEQSNGKSSGIGSLMVENRSDQVEESAVTVALDADRLEEVPTAAEPCLGVEVAQKVDRLSAPTEERIEGEDGPTKSSDSLETRFMGTENGKEDHDSERGWMEEETSALESPLCGRPQQANGVSIPAETIQDMRTNIYDEHAKISSREESLEVLSQVTFRRSCLLEECGEMPSPSHVTSDIRKEEGSVIVDARGEGSTEEERGTHQPHIGEVGSESESVEVLPVGATAPVGKVDVGREDNPLVRSQSIDIASPMGMWHMIKRVMREDSFADELDGIRRHLYLSIVARDFLQMQLDEQTELTAEFYQQSSDEVSKLLGLVKEAQESKAMASKELTQCQSELQAVTIAKEELEIRFISAREEIGCLYNRASELQNELERSEKELALVSSDLTNCRGFVEALQKENRNLTASINSETNAKTNLEQEKELLSSENMRLASELLEQKEKLLLALEKQKQLECSLRETGAYFDQLTEENLYLFSSSDIHKAKIKELDDAHIDLLFQAQQAGDQENTSHAECIATDNAVEDSRSSMRNSIGLQKVDEKDSGNSVVLGILKRQLDEAKSILQKLENSIQGMRSHSMSLSRSSGRATASGVSKLIQAFESKKAHHTVGASDEVPLTEAGQSDDLYKLTREQMDLLRDTLKQMELDVRNAEAHVMEEQDSRAIAQKYEMECEAQRQQNSIFQVKFDELVKKLSNYICRIDDLQNQFNKIRQGANYEEERLLSEVQLLQKEVSDRLSTMQHERDSIKGVFEALEKLFPSAGLLTSYLACDEKERLLSEIHLLQKDMIDRDSIKGMIFEALEKLDLSTGLLFSDNLDIGSRVTASVDAAIKSIRSLHEKLNAAHLNHETLRTSYMELDDQYSSVQGMNELAIGLMHKMYNGLQELCPNVGDLEMDVSAEEVLELLPKRHEVLIKHQKKLLDERVLFLSKNKELETGLLSKNKEIEDLSKRCSALDKKLDDLCYAKGGLETILISKNEVFDEANRRCLALAKKLDDCELNKDPSTLPGLAKINKVIVKSDDMENDLSKSLLPRLEALVAFHLQKYQEAIEQINLSKEYLKEVNFIPNISSENWSLPLLSLLRQEFIPKFGELQEKLDSLSALNLQQEMENQIHKEALHKMEEALEASRSKLHLKVSELEQSEQKLSSVREKLSIAVAKGKGLLVQRDSLKQSLMEKSSELEKCSQELKSKEELLKEVEAKLKSYSEADRIKALESELSYIRHSATALRDSFLLKDSVLQRIEEVLEDLDLPEHFHSKDIVERIEFLSRAVAGNPPFPVTEWDQRSSVGGSHSDADAWKDDLQSSLNPEFDELKSKYEDIQRKFYGLAEHNDMLEQSLMERKSLMQKWEEVLDRIYMPLQFRTGEPVDRIEWLGNALSEVQQERDALQLKIENLEDSSEMLIFDLEGSHKKISELSTEVVAIKSEKDFFSESLEKLRFEYLGLSEKAVHDEIDREILRKELADLRGKLAEKVGNKDCHDIENEVWKLFDLVSDALPDSDRSKALSAGTITECLEGLLRKLIDKYTNLASEKYVHGKSSEQEFVLEERNLPADKNTLTIVMDGKEQELMNLRLELDEACHNLASVKEERDEAMEKCRSLMLEVEEISKQRNLSQEKELVNLRLELNEACCNLDSLKEERDEAMERCHSLMLEVEELIKQRNLLQEEKTVDMERYQSLLLELEAISKQRDALQDQLAQEEQKSASVREKLSVAVRKGKALVQQRDSLKQEIEEMSGLMDKLKTEHDQRVEALESEKSLLMNRLAEKEQSLQDSSETFSRFLTALHGVDVGCVINVTDPVQKIEKIGRLSHDLHSAVVSSENEAKKSKRAAELLLAELNEVQERAGMLQEELAKAEATLTECSRQKDMAEAARIDALNHLEQFILVNSEEKNTQIDNLLELKSGIGQLKDAFFEFSSLLANVFTRDLSLFCNLETFMESFENQMNCANLADLPVLSSSSFLSSNPVNEEKSHAIDSPSDLKMQEQFGDTSIAEHLAITGHIVFECLRQCDDLKRNIHKHSFSVDHQATCLLQIMETVQRNLSALREGSESLKRDVTGLELMIKEKENQICSMSRNLSLLYEACSSSITEIENRKAQMVENSLPSDEHALERTGTVLKLPYYMSKQDHADGYTYIFTDECISSVAAKLVSIVKGTSIMDEMTKGNLRELKSTIVDLQGQLQEKDIKMNRICEDLVSQIRDAEAATKRSLSDLDSAKTKIHNLEQEVEMMKKDKKLLELRIHELKDLEASSNVLQEKIKSVTDALTAKDQAIEALMQALDEEETQMEDVESRNKELESIIQEKKLKLESLEASHVKAVAKLSTTVSKFDELHNLSESLLAEVEYLQSQLQEQDLEISFLRQEVTRCTNDVLASQQANKKYSSEICKLLKWFDMIVSRFGVQHMDIDVQEFSQIHLYTDVLEQKISSVMTELDDLRVTVKSKDALLQIERRRVEELSCTSEVLENSLREKEAQIDLFQEGRFSGQLSSVNSPQSLEIEQMNNKASSGAVVSHVRTGRKVNNDQIAISIDSDNADNVLVDEDDDKAHGFKSLTMSRFVPRATRPLADRIDGIWVSGERLLMRQPSLRLGFLIYWAALHALLASFI